MTAKRWLGTLARHYPSLLVSGVCHKAIGEIEDLEAKLAVAVEALEEFATVEPYRITRESLTPTQLRQLVEYVARAAADALAKIKETKDDHHPLPPL